MDFEKELCRTRTGIFGTHIRHVIFEAAIRARTAAS